MTGFFDYGKNNNSNNFELFKKRMDKFNEEDAAKNEELSKFFGIFDTDKNGKIDNKEALSIFRKISEEKAGDDGILDNDELEGWIKSENLNLSETETQNLLAQAKTFFEGFMKQEKSEVSENDNQTLNITAGNSETIYTDDDGTIFELDENGFIQTCTTKTKDLEGYEITKTTSYAENTVTKIIELEGKTISKEVSKCDAHTGQIVSKEKITFDTDNTEILTTTNYKDGLPYRAVSEKNGITISTAKYDYTDPDNPVITTACINEYGTVTETVYTRNNSVSVMHDTKDLFNYADSPVTIQVKNINGKIYTAEYDERGYTKIAVQVSETPALVAQRLKIPLQELLDANQDYNNGKGKKKGLKKDSMLHPGDVLYIPGRIEADNPIIAKRKSADESRLIDAQHTNKLRTENVYSSVIDEIEVTSDLSSNNVYDFARKYLIKNGANKNESGFNEKVNNLATEIKMLNKPDIKFSAGNKVILPTKTLNKELTDKLRSLGFPPNEENSVFYARFNLLSSQQQQNIIAILKSCKKQNITDRGKINSIILKYYPELQMFTTDPKELNKPTAAMIRRYTANYLYSQVEALYHAFLQAYDPRKEWYDVEGWGQVLANNIDDVLHEGVNLINDAADAVGLNNGGPLIGNQSATHEELKNALKELLDLCSQLVKITEEEYKYKDAPLNQKVDKNSFGYYKMYEDAYNDVNGKIYNITHEKTYSYDNVAIDYNQVGNAIAQFQKFCTENPNATEEQINKEAEKMYAKLPQFKELENMVGIRGKVMGVAGNLTSFAIDLLFAYLTGGMGLVARSAKTAYTGTRYTMTSVQESLTKTTVGKVLLKENVKFVTREGAAMTASILTSSVGTAAVFSGINLTKAFVNDWNISEEEFQAILHGQDSLTQFGIIGSVVAGPVGSKTSELVGKLFNSEPAIAGVIRTAAGEGTTLDAILGALSKNSETLAKVTQFGTSFAINAGWMAYSDGMTYGEALMNLGEMDGISKMVAALLGGKNTAFLTPQKVEKIKTSLKDYKVDITTYKGKKLYQITDKLGKVTNLKNEQEVFTFIIKKELEVINASAAEGNFEEPQNSNNDLKETNGKKPYQKPEIKTEELAYKDDIAAKTEPVVNDRINEVKISDCILQNSENMYRISINGKDITFKVNGSFSETGLSALKTLCEKVDDTELLQNLNNALVQSGCLSPRKHIEQIERIYNYKKQNPDFPIEQILNHELALDQNATENFNLVNSLLFGEKPEIIKTAEQKFEQDYGVKIHLQYNTTSVDVIEDITGYLSKAIERFKATGRRIPSDIYLTDVMISNKLNGYFVASKSENKNWHVVLKNANINHGENYFNKTFFHESVHMCEMNVFHDELYKSPIGTVIDSKTGGVSYDENKGARLIANTKKYVSNYSAKNISEFKAEMGALMLQDKITVEFVGEEIKVSIKEPFINHDGIEIKIDDIARREIEELVDYYYHIGGVDLTRRDIKPAKSDKPEMGLTEEKPADKANFAQKKQQLEDALNQPAKMLIENLSPENKKSILDNVSEDNIDFAIELASNPEVKKYFLPAIFGKDNAKNISAQKRVYNIIKESNDPNLKKDLMIIVNTTNADNVNLATELLSNSRINKGSISNVLSRNDYPEGQMEIFNLIKNNKNLDGVDISTLLQYVTKYNCSYIKKMIADGNINNDNIRNSIMHTNERNISIAEKLYNNPEIPKEDIGTIIMHVCSNDKTVALFNRMYNGSFPKNQIASVLDAVYNSDINLANALLDAPEIPGEMIAGILKINTKETEINNAQIIQKYSNENLINAFNNFKPTNSERSKRILSYLDNFSQENLAGFDNYIKNIDMNKLEQLAPSVKDFNELEKFYFLSYYYNKGIIEFKPEDLKISDFTDYLSKNYLDAEGLTQLLSILPNTDRNVGVLPEGWIKGLNENSALTVRESVNNCVDKFMGQKEKDTKVFAAELSEILGKKVEVSKLGGGEFKTAYKVSVEGTEDVVLGIFHASAVDLPHGMGFEPQAGIFLNNNSSQFAHMYFGRVAPIGARDGFLVTQYIDKSVTNKIKGQDNPDYVIWTADNNSANFKDDLDIDYGGAKIQIQKEGNQLESVKTRFVDNLDFESAPKFKMESADNTLELNDYINVVNFINENYPSKNAPGILNAIKSPKDTEILKVLFDFKLFFGGEQLSDITIMELLPKLNSVEEAREFLKGCDFKYNDSEVYRKAIYYKTPYENLCNKLIISTWDETKVFDILTKVLDSPEKIKQAEVYCDNLSNISKTEKIKSIYGKIADINVKNNQTRIKDIITDVLGEEIYNNDFAGKIDLAEMTLQNPSQVKAIRELLVYYEDPFFVCKAVNNRHDLNCIINDVIPQIKTAEDVVILRTLLKSETKKNQKYNEIYVASFRSQLRNNLENGTYFPGNELAINCRKFLVNNKLISDLNIQDQLETIKNITSENMLDALNNYYKSQFNNASSKKIQASNLKDIVNDIQNEYALEALNVITDYNNKNRENPVIIHGACYNISLKNINSKESLEYFKSLLNKENISEKSLNEFLIAGSDKYKQGAILIMSDSKYSDGKYKLNDSDIIMLSKIIKSEEDVENLKKALNKKKHVVFERKINANTLIEEILTAKNGYYSQLKQKVSANSGIYFLVENDLGLAKYAVKIENDADFEFAVKLANNHLSADIIDLTRNNQEARALVTDIIDNMPDRIHSIDIENYLQRPNGLQKIRDLLTLSPEQYTKDLNSNLAKQSSGFYTENYLHELQRVKNNDYELKHFEGGISKEQLLAKTEAGEVVCVGGKLYINDSKSMVPLKISENTYNKLFPVGEQFNTAQGELGDCWLVSTIDGLMQSPAGRAKILSLYEERPNGDIVISLPGADSETFLSGEPYYKDNGINVKHSNACTGIRLLEEACAFAEKKRAGRINDKNYKEDIYTDMEKTMSVLDGGNTELSFTILLGDIGIMPEIQNKAMYEKVLNSKANNPNVITRAGTSKITIPVEIRNKYAIEPNHAYDINGYDTENKIVYVINPHDTKFRSEIPLEIFKKYFDGIKYLELDPYTKSEITTKQYK